MDEVAPSVMAGAHRRAFERAALDRPALRSFVDLYLRLVHESTLSPSGKVAAATMFRRAVSDHVVAVAAPPPGVLVHDELLLHRAFSILPRSKDPDRDAVDFFALVPVPEVAVLVGADTELVLERVRARSGVPNCYRDLPEAHLRAAVEAGGRVLDVAEEMLRTRGVDVRRLDASGPMDASVDTLLAVVAEYDAQRDGATEPPGPEGLRERLRQASGSFRKKDGRHHLRTRDVMYCAFSTPGFTVTPGESQRDAGRRLANFGLDRAAAEGRTALDLGSNAGAMLFELSGLGLACGLGVEFDQDKVDLATEIAALSGLDRLRFEQGDIDEIDPARLGRHDIVLALAIESHVQQQDRLYDVLGQVTGSTLYFEGNSRCDVAGAEQRLLAVGFTDVRYLGHCDDDRDPRNNTRLMLVARRGS